jgi:hypothetical protein
VTKGALTTVAGQRVVPLRDKTNGGTLYIAAGGPAYPIEIYKPGANGGHFYFSQFNHVVALQAPANAIDITKLG